MDFQKNFSDRLIKDLEDGRYGSATDFAAGITRHYMSSIKLNAPTILGPFAPAQIPLTLPAPALLGAPAPVGPTISINYKNVRRKAFYNTVRAYFVAKELARGRVQVKMLSQDLTKTINLYKKTTQDLKNLYEQIQEVDDRFEALKQDLQNIKPELKKFIQSKKTILKEAKTEFTAIGTRFKQLKNQGLSDFDFEQVMQEELNDLDFFLNFKIEPSINPIDLRETFDTIKGLLDRSIRTTKKYQNIFSKEANYKLYISKKIRAVAKEILDLVNGFVTPEKYISLWKRLIYIPGGKRIGKIMLQIINNNEVLKSLKNRLLIKIEKTKKSVLDYLSRKIDDLLDALKKAGDYVASRLKIKKSLTKFQEKLKASKTLQNTIKRVKKGIDYIKKMIKHLQLVLAEVRAVVTTLANIVNGIKKGIQAAKQVVENIKNKYREIDESFQQSKSPEFQQARQAALDQFAQDYTLQNLAKNERPTEKLVAEIGQNTPIIEELLSEINNLLQLNEKQLAAFLRSRTNHVQVYVKQVDRVLTVSIPRLQILLNTNPNASNYKAQVAAAKKLGEDPTGKAGVKSIVDSKEDLPKTYLFLVDQCRSIGLKLQELENKLTAKVTDETKKLANASKDQDALIIYIDTLLDNKPRLKKVKNKKRRVDLDKAEIQAKVKKFKKLATQSRVAYRMVDSSRNIIQNITQNPQTPISSNERAVRALVNSFCDFQIDRGKMTKLEKKTTLKKYDVKIADLKAYEVIYKFFLEVLKEAQAGKLGDGIRQELGDKYDGLESKVQIYLQSVLDMVTGATKNPSLTTIAKIPVDVFHQIDVATAIIRAEQKAFKRFRGRIANLSGFIPQATQDPVLIYIRSKINKASSIVLLLIDGIAKFVKKIVEFISGLMKPITDFIKKTLSEETEKIKAKEIERQKALVENRTNLDGRVMAAMFGLAGRLFWTGATWTNPAGTRFVVANVGRFSPVMKALNQNGSQGYGEELAKGFNNQLQKMAGLAIPLPSTGIVPFSWKGYVPIQGTFPTTL